MRKWCYNECPSENAVNLKEGNCDDKRCRCNTFQSWLSDDCNKHVTDTDNQQFKEIASKDRFNKDLIKDKNKEINELLDNKLIIIENDYLKATDLGFTILNKIILDLI